MKNADVLCATLRSSLRWHEAHPEYVQSGGKCQLMLGLDTPAGVVDLGFVSKVAAGFFWFVTNPNLLCAYQTTDARLTLEQCKVALFNHALGELQRLHVDSRLDILTTTMRKSDVRACAQNMPVDVEEDSYKTGFHHGLDRGIKTQGLPRKPTWARYLVQNRDGTLTWFEHEPSADNNDGKWTCSSGRTSTILLNKQHWTGSLKKLK